MEHGTYARYSQHRREGDEVCDLCRKAASEYMAEWRAAHGTEESKRYQRSRGRALTKLKKRYPWEFDLLLAEELAKERDADVL